MTTFPIDFKVEAVLTSVFGGGVFGSGVFGAPPWTDITAHVYQRDPITISRGRPNESANVEPSSVQLTIDNRSGDYSPRNPNGAYYGTIGRNNPLRVTVPGPETRLILRDRDADAIATPDSASLSITGDIDVRVELDLSCWHGHGEVGFIGKYEATSDERSWWFGHIFYQEAPDSLSGVQTRLMFEWSPDGTFANSLFEFADVPLPHPATGRIAVRATLDVNNGAGGHTVTFYTSDAIDGTWTQLGTAQTGTGVTSIYNSTADVRINAPEPDLGFRPDTETPFVQVYAAEIRNGIGGAAVASPDFTAQTSDITDFDDAQGNTWTVEGGAEITNRLTRAAAEVSGWPQRWDPTGRDVYAPLDGAGCLRRLSQGGAVPSPMFTELAVQPFLQGSVALAYWPCEASAAATSFPSAYATHPIGRIFSAPVTTAVNDDFVASGPLLEFGGGKWIFPVLPYTDTGYNLVGFNLALPSTISAETVIARIFTTGTAARYDLLVNTSGFTKLRVYDETSTLLVDTGYNAFDYRGKRARVGVHYADSGANIAFGWEFLQEGNDSAEGGSSSVAGTPGVVKEIQLNPDGGLTTTACGHVSLHSDDTVATLTQEDSLNALGGEDALARMNRLCYTAGIPFQIHGDALYTAKMGRQPKKNIVEILRECATADGGILFEPREFFGLGYVTKDALSAREPVVSFDYSAKDLSSIEPVDDDQNTTNDVTVTRQDGGAIRRVEADGPLGTDAIGTQDKPETVNVASDDDLPDQASWRLHLGTVDEARFPTLGVNLARSNFTTDAVTMAAAQSLDVGAKLAVTNPPSWLPPDDIRQLAQGFKETLTKFEWLIDVNCSPASPWDVGVYDAEAGEEETRYESDGSELSVSINTSATSLIVAIPSGPVWTLVDGAFDIVIGGERMTVTAISGTATPQTFTVTRAVNGISKSHPAGAEVRLFKPAYYAL